jgi:hypothetical protein
MSSFSTIEIRIISVSAPQEFYRAERGMGFQPMQPAMHGQDARATNQPAFFPDNELRHR